MSGFTRPGSFFTDMLQNGFTDGDSWVCVYLGDTGVRIWIPGDKSTALALFEQFTVNAPVTPAVNSFGLASRVDVGPRVWDKPAHRWRQTVTDTVNDVSFGNFTRSTRGETAADDRAEILADTIPANALCYGPYSEDLCPGYPPADVRTISLEGLGFAAGWFMVCAKSPGVDPLFTGDFPRITGVVFDGAQGTYLFFAGVSVAHDADGFRVATVASDNGLGNVVLQGVPPWQDSTGVIVGGVDTPTAYPIPDGYELAAIIFLAADEIPTIYHAHIHHSPSAGFQVQQMAGNSLKVRTVYTETDGSNVFADDTIITRGALVVRGPSEASTPTGLHFLDLSASSDVPIVSIDGLPPSDVTVWRHSLRAVWTPGDGDRQRVFVAVDIPEYDSFYYVPFIPDFGPHVGEQCYDEIPATVGPLLTSRVYELPGGIGFLDMDVPPGALVTLYVRGENGPTDDSTPGAAARVQTTMTAYGQESPESDYLSLVGTPIAGEGNL